MSDQAYTPRCAAETQLRGELRSAMVRLLPPAVALTAGVGLCLAPPAQAATFNVTNLSDAGAGSLRQAIIDANTAAGLDSITFQAGLTGTITLTSGQLAVTDSVTITGPGAAALSVSGNNASRVFYLYNSSATIDVTISGLTISGGNASIGAGVIDFDENLTLDSVTISGNTSTGDGGGLWADGFSMTLTVQNSRITGNTSGDDGGGVYAEDTGATWNFTNTVVSGNQAAGAGGGIYFYDPDQNLVLTNTTISGNTAATLGGGVYLYSFDNGGMTFRGSTISGNSAAEGGGLFLYGIDNGPLLIENSTISGNQATAGDGGGVFLYNISAGGAINHTTIAANTATGTGGGVFVDSGTPALNNMIVADNTAGTNNDLGGTFDASYSLIEAPGTATVNNIVGNLLNTDPQLGALANNGGPTQTKKPAGASPAVNAGNPAFAPPPAADQRGLARVVNGRIDMGAVEVNPGVIQLTASAISVNEAAGTVTITLSRTGGSDGAVSVSYATTPGSAGAGADYTTSSGMVNWADGDVANKTFTVPIINDPAFEPNETFSVTISSPQGGATLGATVTITVTIISDDAAQQTIIENVPALGPLGGLALAGLVGLGGLAALRRRRGLAMLLCLALGGSFASPATHAGERDATRTLLSATTVQQISVSGGAMHLALGTGLVIDASVDKVHLVDRRARPGAAPMTLADLPSGTPVNVKVRRAPDGTVQKVKIKVYDSARRAAADAER